MFACATGPQSTLFRHADPESWVALLRSRHQGFRVGESSDSDALHTFAHILSDMDSAFPEGGGQASWQRLFEDDIIPVVVQLLCDFDFDVDIERQGLDPTRNHLSDLLAILAASLGQLSVILSGSGHEKCHLDPKPNCARCSAVDNAFSAFAIPDAPIIQAFLNIWDHRAPLLVSDREAMFWREHCNFDALGDGLHGTVCIVSYQLHRHAEEAALRLRDNFTPTLLHAALLCLTVWVYSVRMPHRDAAVQRLISLVMSTDMDSWNQWYLKATTGCTSPWHISKAFLRDLSDPTVLDARLTARYMIFTKFRMRPLNAPFDAATECLVFWYALASYRRQLCSGYSEGGNEVTRGPGLDPIEVSYNFIAMVLIGSSRQHDATLDPKDPWLPLSHIHAAIPFMARATTSRKTDQTDPEFDDDFCSNLAKMISLCVRYVKLHGQRRTADEQASIAPPSFSMRQFSREYWHEARDRLSAGTYLVNPMWRPVRRAWMLLGEALLLDKYELEGPSAQDGGELPIAKRCAWAECLCSAYNPAHGLRLCKGCSAVAYCNIKCQRSDWETHRGACAPTS